MASGMLFNALWILQPLLKVVILAAMFRRKLHLRHPLFFSFLIFGILETALLYSVRGSYRTYFFAYWATDAVSVLLMLGVIYELFTAMFRQHHALRDFGSMLFRWAVVMVAMMATLLLFTGINPTKNSIINSIMNLDRAMSVVQLGMLLFLLLFSPYLKINWRNQIFGYTLGMGLCAATGIILSTQWIHSIFGVLWFNYLKMVNYNWMLVIWAAYSFLPVAADTTSNMLLRPQRWNEALMDAAEPAHAPVLMGIEDIVERTLTARVHASQKPIHTA